MRDFSIGRWNHFSGFDRMLMTVAATFLTFAATTAHAQTEPAKNPAQAIDFGVPMPEAANVPPPTAADFKPETATAPAATTPATSATVASPAPAAAESAKSPAVNEAAKPATPVATLEPAAEKLRDLITTKNYFDRKSERAAAEAFYKDRSYALLWTNAGTPTASAKSVIAKLADAGSDGLNPADYPVPNFTIATTPEARADADLKLTASMLNYARHAQSGRMHWSRVSADILYSDHAAEPAEVLVNVATAKDAGAALATYQPQHKGYQALKAQLALLRGTTEDNSKKIADGATLQFVKPAKNAPSPVVMEDPRVPALRAKLGITENASDTKYDAKVAEAVRKFQASNNLKVTGALDSQTVHALNAPKSDRQIDIVRVNMERWRWLPRELGAKSLGNAYVILNIPDYSLRVMQNGAPVWTTRVITGKPGQHATPMLTETMKYITVNPTWNVPPSIINNEYLPALQEDPTALDRLGLKLERRADGSIHVSQPPGEANALGRIRFNFPNKFLVYQHDTPDKKLFARDERAFSHGCMRVQNPDQYAVTLLNITMPNDRYTPERIHKMYGTNEIDLKFPTPIPVNITYQTAFVDDAGNLEFRKDVYGRDAKMIAILKGSEGKDMETVMVHPQPNYSPARGNIPQGVAYNDSYARNEGPSFFERLFGGSPTPPPPAPIQRGQARR